MKRTLMAALTVALMVVGMSWSAGSVQARGTATIWNGAYRWQYSNNSAYAKPKLNRGNNFVQLGVHPQLGGVRSLPGWSGAR